MDSKNRIISIVDAELNATKRIKEALDRIVGTTIFGFNDAILAWKHYAENIDKYVLIISDLRIDKLDGFELLEKVKDVNPYVRTILIGDHESKNHGDYQKYMREEIINKFIQKPIGMTELYYEVDTQLHAYAMNMI